VSGCSNATISAIVKGNYTPYSANHGKVVYRKDEKSKGFEVLIYYWDDRDGPELCGWWFGPNVGGDQVWAYHPSRTSISPPSSEWNVPHDGSIDPTFAVSARVAGRAPAKDQSPERAPPRGGERDARGMAEPAPPPLRGSRGGEDRDAADRAPESGARQRAKEILEARGRDRAEAAPDAPPRGGARREPERREEPRDEPDDAGGRAASSHHQHFVEAYNKRRQQAEAGRRVEERQEEPEPPKERPRDEERRGGRPEEEAAPPPRERERSPVARGGRADERRPEGRGDPRGDARGDARGGDRGDARGERGSARGDPRDEPRGDRGGARGDPRDEPRGGRRDEPRDAPRNEREEKGEKRGAPRDERSERMEAREQERRREEDTRRQAEEKKREAERSRRDDERKRVDEARDRDEERRREADRKLREEARAKDEERRKRDDEADRERRDKERAQKNEDMKKKDEELQKKRDEKRREEKVKQDVVDEERRLENAKKRKEDMEKLAEQKKKKAEEDEKAAAEAAARGEEERKALRQQQATLNVLQVLQKLSSATPENFDALKQDLDSALLTELPECGQQQEILKAEADRVLEYARHYVKQVTEQRAQETAKREAQEKQAKDLLDELERLVASAEESSEGVYYTAAPLSGENEIPDLECVRISRDVQKLGKSAMAACSSCADFITHKRPIIEEAESIGEESAAIIAVLLPRIRAATRRTAEAFQQGREHREKVEKRVLASRYVARKEAVFKKYDSDNDGYMTREDVKSYAKAEFKFDIPDENLDKIQKKLFQGDVGVAKDDFQLLKSAVGIARSEEIGRKQRVIRIEREAKEAEEAATRQVRVEARKSELQEILRDSAKALTTLEPAIKEAEKVAEALAGEAGQLGSEELKTKSDIADAHTQDTKVQLEAIRTNIQEIMAEVQEVPELGDFMRGILIPLSSRSDVFDTRLKKALETASSGRQLAQYMALSEYEGLWTEVVVKLRACIENVEGKSTEDLFDHIGGSDITVPEGTPGCEHDTVTTSEIQKFLTGSGCEVDMEKLDKLFGRGATGEAGAPAIADGAAEDAVIEAAEAQLSKEDKKEDATEKAGEAKAEDAKEEAKEEAKDGKEESADKKEDGEKSNEGTETKEEAKAEDKASNGDIPKDSKEALLAAAAEGKIDDEKKEGEVGEIDMAAEAAKALAKMADNGKQQAEEKKQMKSGLHITRADFKRIIRMYYKVTRHCVLSDNLQIEQSSQIRRMDVGEVIEVHRGPTLDVSVNVYRVFCRCIRDGINGWATIAGNTGVTFLMPGGRIFTVKIATVLTEDLKDTEGEKLVRPLAEGEVLEVLEWARTSRSALGVTRIRARAQLDNAVGWATTVGNDERIYLEAM